MNLDNKYQEEQKLLEDMRQTYSLLFIAANKLQTEVDANLEELTSRQLMLLMAVAHCEPTEATIMNISTTLGATKQNITRMAQLMCKKGILVSTASETDKRSVNLQLTERGRCLLEKNLPMGGAYFLKIFESFSPEEIAVFRSFLEKLSDYDNRHEIHLEQPFKFELQMDALKMQSVYQELAKKLKT